MSRRQIAVLAGLVLFGLCPGYGGFGTMLTFTDFTDLNRRLTELNREWLGNPAAEAFRYRSPSAWFGGYGAGEVGPVTLGGSGYATLVPQKVDSLASDLVGLIGTFEAGYAWGPNEYVWFRPCLDLQLGGVFVNGHDLGEGDNFFRYFVCWQVAAAPGLEVMGRVRTDPQNYIGLFVKGSYSYPFAGPQWYGDDGRPDFSLQGLQLQVGLRFGMLPYRPFRI